MTIEMRDLAYECWQYGLAKVCEQNENGNYGLALNEAIEMGRREGLDQEGRDQLHGFYRNACKAMKGKKKLDSRFSSSSGFKRKFMKRRAL